MGMEEIWPLFGLRIISPRLELRPVRDEDLPGLVRAAVAGIHDPDRMPFGVPWTDAEPPQLARSLAQFQWGLRATMRPDNWTVSFTVLREGKPIGVQEVTATQFDTRKTVLSGSWLTSTAQGVGLGTEMRAAMLQWAFDQLGAECAESDAAVWNGPSLAVSKRLGYEPNGVHRMQTRPGEVTDTLRVRLAAASFLRPSWTAEVIGAEPATTFLRGTAN
ncbi:GNAT family N-acetyltransferase [Curtobacterium sp. MCBD17_040]|uniref:GNAT family N-acetyltransferase n=1 Tax=Curtobacterium sp. MCBD17_040 TaxID=2175674 RepID=UPI000DA6ECAB|nr:GNAT family N-acetyltransferase [Curtobacterium sp. MCBD17_040]WIB65730.1 GNAT family N-acetyltransferase [Curtobacterium sp. MCBD17_040]